MTYNYNYNCQFVFAVTLLLNNFGCYVKMQDVNSQTIKKVHEIVCKEWMPPFTPP